MQNLLQGTLLKLESFLGHKKDTRLNKNTEIREKQWGGKSGG